MANEKLVLEINQGCPRGYGFTLSQRICQDDGTYTIVPLDLTDYTVVAQVKKAPYYKLPSLIEKQITTTDNPNVGVIQDAVNGKFTLQFTQDDTMKLPPGEYAFILCMVDADGICTHLSGDGDSYAIFRVCYQ